MTDEIVRRCKRYIDEKNNSALQGFYEDIIDTYDTSNNNLSSCISTCLSKRE